MRSTYWKGVFLAWFVLALVTPCLGSSITFEATNLNDSGGADRWAYSYRVSGNFNMFSGFTVYFGVGDSANISASNPQDLGDWDVLTWEPDPGIPDDGAYDAMALVDNASLNSVFNVGFDWMGSSAPGSQYFEIYDENFQILESGYTTLALSAPIATPEPGTFLLVGFGGVALLIFKFRKSNTEA
ncbi:PEP-CTERM sorting domain-containing protein [Desulfuromonas acetexigens]|uniref:PEP-CTERM sorting domain-containing protein n=1 Tax=Trichloromonas acetexigens TaxID=38815 RepID=A0A550JH94_9BACT|nr:PEP-CTERM sorting domain-containing protein [Desulfuromonas acetexigens]TRO82576.1 PEP-CTERM sorting domain-containing protein [Desulfuromonas acetexigens]